MMARPDGLRGQFFSESVPAVGPHPQIASSGPLALTTREDTPAVASALCKGTAPLPRPTEGRAVAAGRAVTGALIKLRTAPGT